VSPGASLTFITRILRQIAFWSAVSGSIFTDKKDIE